MVTKHKVSDIIHLLTAHEGNICFVLRISKHLDLRETK